MSLRRTSMKPWRRKDSDKVTEALANYVFARDRMTCRAPILARQHGEPIDACQGRLTIEHVHTQSMIGKRAPSDKHHTLSLCWHHNVNGWASRHKDWERSYLLHVEGEAA
jgi:hypothetical protein